MHNSTATAHITVEVPGRLDLCWRAERGGDHVSIGELVVEGPVRMEDVLYVPAYSDFYFHSDGLFPPEGRFFTRSGACPSTGSGPAPAVQAISTN